MAARTPHQRAEAALTGFGLALPETSTGPAWGPTRALRVKGKMFAVFGDRGEADDALTLLVKLPVSAEMVQHLYYVRESKGWFRQYNWVIAHFGPEDDILAEMETLEAWLKQSWTAVAPKRLAKSLC